MLRLGGAVTPFPKLTEHTQLTWHVKSTRLPQKVKPWGEAIINEVDALAQFLLKQADTKRHPEIVALGFWARKANLHKIIAEQTEKYQEKIPAKVFHIGPANVDTVFFYSFLLSLLSGNQNIVRISNRSGLLVYELLSLLRSFLKQNSDSLIANMISVLEYPAEDTSATNLLSEWADMRVIWGGDDSIAAVNAISPHTNQLTFPDRFSIALLKIECESQVNEAVEGMRKDILPFRQQACSSPKAIFWFKTPQALQTLFFRKLNNAIAKEANGFDIRDHVEQFVDCQRIVIANNVIVNALEHSQVTHLSLSLISPDLFDSHSGHGLMLSADTDTLENLPFADKLQTIAVFNIPLSMQESLKANPHVKRVTQLGSALSFHHIWDGVDLCQSFGQLKCR